MCLVRRLAPGPSSLLASGRLAFLRALGHARSLGIQARRVKPRIGCSAIGKCKACFTFDLERRARSAACSRGSRGSTAARDRRKPERSAAIAAIDEHFYILGVPDPVRLGEGLGAIDERAAEDHLLFLSVLLADGNNRVVRPEDVDHVATPHWIVCVSAVASAKAEWPSPNLSCTGKVAGIRKRKCPRLGARAHAEKVADDFAKVFQRATAVRVTNDLGEVVFINRFA